MAYATLGSRYVAASPQGVLRSGDPGNLLRSVAENAAICAETTRATSPDLLAKHASRQSKSLYSEQYDETGYCLIRKGMATRLGTTKALQSACSKSLALSVEKIC